MGQYLAIGLRLELAASKQDVAKHLEETPLEEVLKQIEDKYHLNDIYEREDHDDYYVFKVKEELLDRELIPFLEKFYSLRYPAGSDIDAPDALQALKGIDNTNDRLKLLSRKSFQTYQEGEDFDYCRIGGFWSNKVRISSSNAILSIDGKILMECYGGVFDFFRRCIVAQMSDFKLAEALTVWIDG